MLTTASDMTNMLKLDTTMGEAFAKKFYLYTRLTNKTLKPTQYWSKKWPSERVPSGLQKASTLSDGHFLDQYCVGFDVLGVCLVYG